MLSSESSSAGAGGAGRAGSDRAGGSGRTNSRCRSASSSPKKMAAHSSKGKEVDEANRGAGKGGAEGIRLETLAVDDLVVGAYISVLLG